MIKISSKKIILVLALSSLIVLSGCKFWPFGGKPSPEAALPKDSQFVVTIDHSDEDQVRNMKKLFAMLPDFGIGKDIENKIFNSEELAKEGIDYKKDILPILEGDFKASLAIDFSKYGKNEGFVFSIYTNEKAKMKALLEKKKASGKFVYGNDGDIFVFAFTQGEVDAGMKALKEGNGFSTNENFKSASKDSKSNLGYVYIEMGDVVKNFLASSSAKGSDTKSLEEVKAQIGTLKNVYFDLVAKDDGFEFGGLGNLSDDKDLIAKMMPYFGKKLSLFDKVPLENPILYMELPNVGQYIASFVAGFRGSSGAGGVADLQKDYDDFLTLVSGFGGISKDEAKGIFESPFAFAVGDSWEKYPTVAFYFDVDAKYADAAKKFVGALDAYADAVVKEFEGMIGVSGVLNKTAAVVKGGGIYKLYIDFKNVPDQLLSNFALMPGFDVKKTKLEFYYGLTGDNVLSVALYPQFDKVYGEKTVSKDKYVSEAIKDKTSFFTFFLSPEKLINFVDTNYYKMAKDNGILVADYAKYYALAKDTMQVLRYFVSSYSMPRNDKILFNSFLKFQEVKKNEALEKVKEGK